jgi:NUMOD3 motif
LTKLHNDYYTYAFLREDKTPYYIGKGRGKRIYSKHRGVKAPKGESRIIFLKKNLTEAEAFNHEVYMIFVLGRKDLGTGILRNLTNGGDGASGTVNSEETKKKKSEAKSGENNPFHGRTGENHPSYGVPKTEEWKKAHSEKMSGRYLGALSPISKAIIAIKLDGTELHFGSVNEAARELGIHSGNLCSKYLKTGKSPTRGKFKGWQFAYENLAISLS